MFLLLRIQDIGRDDCARDDVAAPAALDPPQRPLLQTPLRGLAGQGQRGRLAQRRLVTDHDDSPVPVGPSGGIQYRLGTGGGPDIVQRFVMLGQRGRGLLGALRRANQHSSVLGQPFFQPARHMLSLLLPLAGQRARIVRHAVLRVGMTPQYQVHRVDMTG